ncbi:MAG: phage tail protein [Lachnospiraceae bacterium]|nr:phage tail protein [Lachnospiraceae bacterium]
MAQIGNLGSLITFEVSSDKILTFSKLTRTVKGRWNTHNVISGKPVSEFLGPDVGTIQLPIYLSVMHGVKPIDILDAINDAVENGEAFTFVIGGRKIGNYQWKITNASEVWGSVIKDGQLASANLTLTLEEYA